MRSEIVSKLSSFLSQMPFEHECQVVYLLVEIRKILEHGTVGNYPILRFYADWSVHTAKDRNKAAVKGIMEKIYREIQERQKKPSFADPDPKLLPFISMSHLRAEIDHFLQAHQLPDDLVSLKENWPRFQRLLAGVLADQPITNPCQGMRKFSFRPATRGQIRVEIEFEKTPGVYVIETVTG